MSTTLAVLPQPHQFQLNQAIHDNNSRQFTPRQPEDKSVTQLAPLASQHHTSDYNRIKFGPQGCPIIYTPLSIHMPEHVMDLQARQTRSTQHKTWWPCDPPITSPPPTDPVVLGPCGASAPTTADLQEELSAAISESIPQPLPETSRLQLKTSDTHPINISMIIPLELIPVISSHLVPSRKPSPTLFDVHPSYTLDWVTSSQALPSPTPALPPEHTHKHTRQYHTRSSSVATAGLRSPFTHLRTRTAVTEALQAAISSGLAAAVTTTVLGGLYGKPKGSVHDPSPANQKEMPEFSGSPVYPYQLSSLASTSTHKLSLFVTPSHTRRSANNTRSTPPQTIPTETTSILKQPRPLPSPCPPRSKPPVSLGNLLLSSCPGKKVRLTGPVKGRGGVCRDVRTDMRRMRSLGVRCIICCLDNVELEFLGAPWDEYVCAAGEIGMDVLRIPTPEGLTPLTPSSLDRQLTHLIKTYTLQGVNMLVHCRGGVGRAGLIGCCWLLRLGLCGWIETGGAGCGGGWGNVRRDTLQLVERAISVVRKRRSIKAVETYEQVKFLADYVDFLRERTLVVE